VELELASEQVIVLELEAAVVELEPALERELVLGLV
jgi:hypothetical protein